MNKIIAFILSCLVIGCSTSKKSSYKNIKTEKKDVVYNVINNHTSFETFYAKCQTKYSSDDSNLNFKATVKIKKDSVIWISLSALFGIEVFQAIILPDSVVLVDKFNAKFFSGSISSLDAILNTSFDFYTLQNIITNQPLIDFNKKHNFNKSEKHYHFEFSDQDYIEVKKKNFQPSFIKLHDGINEISVNYKNYRLLNSKLFPYSIALNAKKNKLLELNLDYIKVKINPKLNYLLTIPEGYAPMF